MIFNVISLEETNTVIPELSIVKYKRTHSHVYMSFYDTTCRMYTGIMHLMKRIRLCKTKLFSTRRQSHLNSLTGYAPF
jgi:hypothetical protein